MRVTSSMYYKNVFADSSRTQGRLFDVNKQISSGLKIQYAGDDVSTFTETMRLDNELTTLQQVKKSNESGFKMSNQADVILNEFETAMNRTKTLLLSAANGTNSPTSLDAVAQELRGIETNLKGLANSSINGQYLFSGSAIDTKPISDNGTYNGNDVPISAFLGSGVHQQYNLTGANLFLGEEVLVKREITSNVVQKSNVGTTLDGSTTMADFMGSVPGANQHNFYLRGTQSDGTAFTKQIQLANSDTVDTLLGEIGKAYGNSGSVNVVNVSMNSSGQIIVQDKLKGSSKLDFHMVGASDFDATDNADITTATNNIKDLDTGNIDYDTAQAAANKLYVREFNISPYSVASGGPTIGGSLYDKTQFSVAGSSITSNVSQINKDTNAFATPSTKLIDVASGTSLNGKQLTLSGKNSSGVAFTVQVDLATAGSTFSPDGGVTNYDIFSADTPRVAVDADKMTYKQLMDVVNMVVTNQIPASTNSSSDYDNAIDSSNGVGNTSLSYDGKIKFDDLQSGSTKAELAIYDSNSGDFSAGNASVLTFNTNNSLTIRDPKTDFFKTINEMITAVENHKVYPDSTNGDVRNAGIQNAISMIDDLQDHVFRSHSFVGAQSNTLSRSLERVGILEISTQTLRSSVIDTDLAEASLTLTQLSLNFQAMLSSVGKISQLSLVNYL